MSLSTAQKQQKTNFSYKVKKDSNYKIVRILDITNFYGNGAPERTRTSGTQFRKLLLYPAELRALNIITKVFYQTIAKVSSLKSLKKAEPQLSLF